MFAMVMMGVMAVACLEKDEPELADGSSKDLLGEWKLVKEVVRLEKDGTSTETEAYEIPSMSYEFLKDGTGAVYYNDNSGNHIAEDPFTWSYKDGKLAIKTNDHTYPMEAEVAELAKDRMVLHYTEVDGYGTIITSIMTYEKL